MGIQVLLLKVDFIMKNFINGTNANYKQKKIIDIKNCNLDYSASALGGKGSQLVKLFKEDIPVVDGIIIPTDYFREFVLKEFNSYEGIRKIEDIQEYMSKRDFPVEFKEKIKKVLEEKNIDTFIVRSSSNLEDNDKYSFAGVFLSVLNVKQENLFDAINKVYASAFDKKVLSYIEHFGIPLQTISMAVVIQEFIDTDYGGVAFTIDPVSKNNNKIIIEIVKGLGESLVSGEKTPCDISINKLDGTLSIINKEDSIDEKTLKQLAEQLFPLILKIEKVYNKPVDIEFGIKDNDIKIFQAREITT
jgi:pyruvate,water dikinase